MTETLNFGLKKPDLSDPVDVRVFNENFDKIDEQMGVFYNLFDNPEGYVPDWNPAVNKFVFLDVTEHVDPDEVSKAVDAGKTVRMWWKNSANEMTAKVDFTHVESKNTDSEQNTWYMGYVPHAFDTPGQIIIFLSDTVTKTTGERNVQVGFSNDMPERFLTALKGQIVQSVNGNAPDADGNVEVATSRTATAMDLSNWDNGTFTVDFSDGTRMNGTVTFDEAGNPVTISDGTNTMTITWPAKVTA